MARTGKLAACALLGLLAACDHADPGGVRLRTDDPAVLAQGEAVYRARCAGCHGANLEGQPDWRQRDAGGRLPAPPHDASGHTWHHPDQVLFALVKDGVAKAAHLEAYDTAMPAFGGTLGDGEIVAVLSWIKSRWPDAIRRQQEEVDRQARRQAQAQH